MSRMTPQQDHPGISPIVHPPIVVLLFIAIAYFLGRFLPIPFAVPSVLRTAGLLIGFAGFLLGIAASIEFSRTHTTLNPHGPARQLVTSGIYRMSRNPIYLGFLLMLLGLPLYSGSYWGVILSPSYVFVMNHLVLQHEEAYLQRKFKEAYARYASRVRRWL
jgi:protein-S-isoprenylcysteine O-methyltransferase Ste14